MFARHRTNRDGEAGFSLVEMLVASAIFAIAVAVAFILYSAAQRSYKAGQNFSDQQQNTRAAFDRVLSDLRNAGYNTNPDGAKTRPDEQIEAAFETAIVLRADFDFEDATLNAAPETNIKGVFNAVSTGNDEIVAYVLAKPGWTGGSTLVFNADVDNPTRNTISYLGNNISVGPRDGTVEPVRMGNVALVQDSPPYTLYRVTLNNDLASYSSGANPTNGNFFTRTPVADNLRSMTFKYYDDQGNPVGPSTPTDPSDDIGGSEAAASKDVRTRIRRIVVDLVGMTPDPDLRYSDPAEASTSSTVHYRKFRLASDVTPENLGRSGMQDSDNIPPGQVSPAPTLCGGHCQGVLVNWVGRPANELVSSYNIGYGTSSAATPYLVNAPYPHYENGVADYDTHYFIRDSAKFTQGSSWYFKVQAKDSSANVGIFSGSTSSGAIADTTVPAASSGGYATQKGSSQYPPLDGAIRVNWNPVTTNATGPTGCTDSDAPLIRDLKGYRVWRGTTSGFTPTGTPLVDEATLPESTLQWTDTNVIQCQTYYYKVVAADLCGIVGAASPGIPGSSDTIIPPMSPSTVTSSRTGQNQITVTWSPVTLDEQSRTIQVAQYKVFYAQGTVFSPPSTPAFQLLGSPSPLDGTTFVHALTTGDKDYLRIQNNVYYYAVQALDACPNASLLSYPSQATCTFNGTPSMSPGSGTHVAGSVPISLTVSGGGDTYTRARIRIVSNVTGTEAYNQEVLSYPFSFPSWNASTATPGDHTVYIEVENSNGCINYRTQTLIVDSILACQITPSNPNLTPTTGKAGGDKKSDLTFDIVNNSSKDLYMVGIDVTWTNNLGFNPLLNSFAYPSILSPPNLVWSPAAPSPASKDFGFQPILSVDNDSSSPVEVKLDFTNSLVSSNGSSGETITITFRFRDDSNTPGSCTFQVVAQDLTITTQ